MKYKLGKQQVKKNHWNQTWTLQKDIFKTLTEVMKNKYIKRTQIT